MSSFANKLNASFSERFIYLHEINYPVVKNDFKRAYRSKKIGDIFKSYPDLYNNRISFEDIGESVIGSIKYNKVRSIFTCSIMGGERIVYLYENMSWIKNFSTWS